MTDSYAWYLLSYNIIVGTTCGVLWMRAFLLKRLVTKTLAEVDQLKLAHRDAQFMLDRARAEIECLRHGPRA